MDREGVLSYARKKYGTKPDYPWKRDPDSVVLRHEDSHKWYGLIMCIRREKLGLPGNEPVDILNVKCDPALGEVLRTGKGIFPAYHMNRFAWISVLLDGTVPEEKVLDLLDMSYSLTASQKKKENRRGPKEWLVPANPKFYDIEEAFRKNKVIDWKQSSNVKVGDTVYMYVAAPVSAILYKCRAVEVDIPYEHKGKYVTISRVMRLELLEQYDRTRFTFDVLKKFGVYAVRGPRSMPNSLSCEINGVVSSGAGITERRNENGCTGTDHDAQEYARLQKSSR